MKVKGVQPPTVEFGRVPVSVFDRSEPYGYIGSVVAVSSQDDFLRRVFRTKESRNGCNAAWVAEPKVDAYGILDRERLTQLTSEEPDYYSTITATLLGTDKDETLHR